MRTWLPSLESTFKWEDNSAALPPGGWKYGAELSPGWPWPSVPPRQTPFAPTSLLWNRGGGLAVSPRLGGSHQAPSLPAHPAHQHPLPLGAHVKSVKRDLAVPLHPKKPKVIKPHPWGSSGC